VGRLLLTHVPAWVDRIGQLADASAVFPETELVSAGAVYDI
jgi:ribonuclease BN (tRNA processing enzyme)